MRAVGSTARRTAQTGVAAVLLLVIVVMGSLYALLSGVNTATAELQQKRDDTTTAALKQAKEALIARAALDANRPGSLPCPDLVTNIAGNVPNDGVADLLAGLNCPSYIGRLPWRTLGLPDLRDSSGERLWYALSANFRDSNTAIINSDTQGDLTVQGVSPAANVVAIVFAPGAAVGNQNRGAVNDVTQYLEAENAGGVATTYVTARRCERTFDPTDLAPCLLGPFNDQLIAITHGDLFDVVENVVAKRLAEVRGAIESDYVPAWRTAFGLAPNQVALPFAARYNDTVTTPPPAPTDPSRVQNDYKGGVGLTYGLLPLTRDSTFLQWETGGVIVETRTLPSGSWTVVVPAPGPTDNPTSLDLTVNHDAVDREYRIAATLRNVGLTFARPISAVAGTSVTQSMDTNGNLQVTYTVSVTAPPAGPPAGPLDLTVPKPQFSTVTGAGTTTLDWFIDNLWYRHVLYVASPGVVPTSLGTAAYGTCVAPPSAPSCVQVDSVRPGDAQNDARIALALAGRNLRFAVRTWTLADYFEGKNDDGTLVLERQVRSVQFNDKVVAW